MDAMVAQERPCRLPAAMQAGSAAQGSLNSVIGSCAHPSPPEWRAQCQESKLECVALSFTPALGSPTRRGSRTPKKNQPTGLPAATWLGSKHLMSGAVVKAGPCPARAAGGVGHRTPNLIAPHAGAPCCRPCYRATPDDPRKSDGAATLWQMYRRHTCLLRWQAAGCAPSLAPLRREPRCAVRASC